MSDDPMPRFFGDGEPLTLEELIAGFDRSLANMPRADAWEPKVLGFTPDGGKIVSTLDWLRLRRDNIEGWEDATEITVAHETYRMAKAVADEQQSGLSDHVAKQKSDAEMRAAAIVAHVRVNPRGSLQKTPYIADVALACGVSTRTVRKALKRAAITF